MAFGRAVGAGGQNSNVMTSDGFEIQQVAVSYGYDPCCRIDGKAAAGIITQAIADRGAGIGIGCQGGDPDDRASVGVLDN